MEVTDEEGGGKNFGKIDQHQQNLSTTHKIKYESYFNYTYDKI